MEDINLDKLKREEHWSKQVFIKRGISIGDVARVLGLSYTYVSGMLSGNIKVTEDQEKRIKEFVNYLNQ